MNEQHDLFFSEAQRGQTAHSELHSEEVLPPRFPPGSLQLRWPDLSHMPPPASPRAFLTGESLPHPCQVLMTLGPAFLQRSLGNRGAWPSAVPPVLPSCRTTNERAWQCGLQHGLAIVPHSFLFTSTSPRKPGLRLYLAAPTWQGGACGWRRERRRSLEHWVSSPREGKLSSVPRRCSLDAAALRLQRTFGLHTMDAKVRLR